MESTHCNRLTRHHRAFLEGRLVFAPGIPDNDDHLDEELIRILKVKCSPYIP
jgi:predicted protein tyrosine phosphatase